MDNQKETAKKAKRFLAVSFTICTGSTILSTDEFNISAYFSLNLK